ncbi:hypothetical protein HGR_08949 [Hylemonella gracilis ATCC 19624]|uniref:Uncharacterized protein n=1 Tax=Hylemonella gracilis ATCC 19624 TaxID=887062 RepID=F3KTK9_9BURK|nr:hypothetical protein HGR_08949 [Hylemonella gracilis ATCC 19624]
MGSFTALQRHGGEAIVLAACTVVLIWSKKVIAQRVRGGRHKIA